MPRFRYAAGMTKPASASRAQPSPRADARLALVVLLAAVAFLFALRVAYLDLPLERDEGEYAYVAQRLFAPDFVPYRDAFVHKPPGAFLVFFAALHSAGESVRGIRVFALLWMVATLLAVAAVARSLAGPLAGALAAFAFAATHAAPALLGPTANTEMLLLLPMVGSLALVLRAGASGRALTWVGAGALAAAACWFKPLAVPHALWLAGYAAAGAPLARGARPDLRTRLVWLAALAAGALAASLPIVVYFAARGAFRPFLDAVFLYNAGYGGAVSPAAGLSRLLGELRAQLPGFWSVWLLAALALVGPWALSGRLRAWLGLWLLACFTGLSLGLYYRAHYFMLWVPALCILAALVADRALLRSQASAAARSAALALLLVLIAGPAVGTHLAYLEASSPAAVSRMLYGLNPFAESEEIAAAIRRITAPDESVFIVGSEPQILFHARRRSATRYILTYPLMSGDRRAGERQAEALEELQRARPGALLIVRIPTSHLRHGDAPDDLLRGVMAVARERYELDAIWQATPLGYRALDGEAARALDAGPLGARWQGVALYRRVDAAGGAGRAQGAAAARAAGSEPPAVEGP
jgi:4-amino-4-deoxy-L-arabinose transferase-like glycosyltransferase